MTWLRILTAAGILLLGASVVLVFALSTAAARGDRDAPGEPSTEAAARASGLIPPPEGEQP
ncbi:hypothetical protein [Kitasatospora sp. NPDC057223]|uniref:hypothetical protein n=1 Tax=Kitasatospora sp. NPDC057223 TaxID=3346055 RepID=UPI00362EBE12